MSHAGLMQQKNRQKFLFRIGMKRMNAVVALRVSRRDGGITLRSAGPAVHAPKQVAMQEEWTGRLGEAHGPSLQKALSLSKGLTPSR